MFHLPLSPAEFADALQKGKGRAWLHVHTMGVPSLADALLAACLHDQTYDHQTEGSRGDWLAELLLAGQLTQQWLDVVNRDDKALLVHTDFTAATLRCDIAYELAKRANPSARAYLYASLAAHSESQDLVAAEEIIALDGAAGLVHVASFLGQLVSAEPTLRLDECPLTWYDERHGHGAARQVLVAAAEQTPVVAAYLSTIDAQATQYADSDSQDLVATGSSPFTAEDHRARMMAIPAHDVVEAIAGSDARRVGFSLRSWGRHASDQAVQYVFAAMHDEREPRKLARYLTVLAARRLPEFDPRLVDYARHADLDVRKAAYRALAHVAHPLVRDLALESLRACHWDEGQLALLHCNFLPQDLALLEPLFAAGGDRDTVHARTSDVINLLECEPRARTEKGLMFVYEATPCGICRSMAVRLMVAEHLAPAWLLAECRHDSYFGVRELVLDHPEP